MHGPKTKVLCLILCGLNYAASTGVIFILQSVPSANWFQLPSSVQGSDLQSKITCASVCIKIGVECHGYELHDDGSCTLGKVQASGSNNYIPEYIASGKRVFLRDLKIQRKAVTGVPHLASIGAGSTFDTALEDTRFGPIDIPAPLSSGEAIIATNYDGGFLSCGGIDENNVYSKKCR